MPTEPSHDRDFKMVVARCHFLWLGVSLQSWALHCSTSGSYGGIAA
jgi:hypothetical protein